LEKEEFRIAKALLKENWHAPWILDSHLEEAIFVKNSTQAALLLLAAGADVWEHHPFYFLKAVEYGNNAIVEYLLAHGADLTVKYPCPIYSRRSIGEWALEYAIRYHHPSTVQVLLSTAKWNVSRFPFIINEIIHIISCDEKCADGLALLFEAGADIEDEKCWKVWKDIIIHMPGSNVRNVFLRAAGKKQVHVLERFIITACYFRSNLIAELKQQYPFVTARCEQMVVVHGWTPL
jgi:hypothetical protein